MRPKTKSMTLVGLDRDGLATDDFSGAGRTFVLDGALVLPAGSGIYTADVPRHIAVYSAGNDAADVFTITGTDRYGKVMTETITGVNATTVAGKKNFATVTGGIVGSATIGNIELGTFNSAETAWIPVEFNINNPYLVSITVSDAATLTAQVEYTLEDPFAPGFDEHSCRKFKGIPEFPCRAIRMRIDDFTDGTATLNIICPR